MRRIILLTVLSTFLLTTIASTGFAFDGYKDRRGVFVGLGLGGGLGGVNVDEESDTTGLDSPGAGLYADAALGAGISQNLSALVQGNLWLRTVKVNDFQLQHQHLSLLPTLDYFLFDGLHIAMGAGLAYASFDTLRDDRFTYRYRELGFAAKASAGYEFFANGTVAAGVQLGYTTHLYGHGSFNTLTGGMTIRWY